MNNILILANTPYQIIVAIQLANTEFHNDNVDLLVSDNIAQYESVIDRISKCRLFNSVSKLISKDLKWPSWKYTLLLNLYGNNISKRIPSLRTQKYDWFLFANTGGVAECIGTYLNKKTNTKLAMYEDGFVSYTNFYKGEIETAIHPVKLKSKLLYFVRKRSVAYLSRYYVFNPSLINTWQFPFDIVRIKLIDKSTLPLLNTAFNYTPTNIFEKYKYIFFEESYFADGKIIGDMEVVEDIAKSVGKENLLIKIHPRNPFNRFAEKGYNTNSDTSTPWEIIALNLNLTNKVLITIASGSSITSYFISGVKAIKSILLYEMEGVNSKLLTPSIEVFNKICKHNDYFVYPHTKEELKEILSNT